MNRDAKKKKKKNSVLVTQIAYHAGKRELPANRTPGIGKAIA